MLRILHNYIYTNNMDIGQEFRQASTLTFNIFVVQTHKVERNHFPACR